MIIIGYFINECGDGRNMLISCEKYCIMFDMFRRKELIKFIKREDGQNRSV